MDQWANLNDFSAWDGNLLCPICKADSSKTLVGNHWKCSGCAHLFNQDKSKLDVDCICDKCQVKANEQAIKITKKQDKTVKVLKQLKKSLKKNEKKPQKKIKK